MKASKEICDEIKRSEGLKLKLYSCSAGKPTIGYGHRVLPTESHTLITETQANEIFKKDIDIIESQIKHYLPVKLTQGKFDAICSILFNYGIGKFIKSKAYKLIVDKEWDKAAIELFDREKGICTAAGKYSEGLYARRQRELVFWNKEC